MDVFGDWEEITLPKTSIIADLGDFDTWPNGVARYRLCVLPVVLIDVDRATSYIPQGQPYCNMSVFLRASGQGEFSSAPDLVATRVRCPNRVLRLCADSIWLTPDTGALRGRLRCV